MHKYVCITLCFSAYASSVRSIATDVLTALPAVAAGTAYYMIDDETIVKIFSHYMPAPPRLSAKIRFFLEGGGFPEAHTIGIYTLNMPLMRAFLGEHCEPLYLLSTAVLVDEQCCANISDDELELLVYEHMIRHTQHTLRNALFISLSIPVATHFIARSAHTMLVQSGWSFIDYCAREDGRLRAILKALFARTMRSCVNVPLRIMIHYYLSRATWYLMTLHAHHTAEQIVAHRHSPCVSKDCPFTKYKKLLPARLSSDPQILLKSFLKMPLMPEQPLS